MLLFGTEFPINPNRIIADFLDTMVTWVSGSPHTKFTFKVLEKLKDGKDARIEIGNEAIQSLIATSTDMELAGVRYNRNDDGLEWTTTVVFSRTTSDAWLGIRVECESRRPSTRLPLVKKPVVVRTVLESLGGADDGALPISDSAHYLNNTDIELAARLIRGEAACRLPIVYISSQFQGGYILDIDRLARDLSGMAHIVVEPNRPFSVRLQLDVDSQNVYGGTVGVYWPEGGGRRAFFLGSQYSTASELTQALKDEVGAALANRRAMDRCTWAYLRETASRQAIQALKTSGSREIDDYVDTFDQEIEAKDQRLQEAEKEIQRLSAELRGYESRLGSTTRALLRLGRERDLYPNELLVIALDAIKDACSRVPKDSRRQHVLQSIFSANILQENTASDRREQLKSLLRGTSSIDPRVRRGLEDMGFNVSEDGKHYKLVFQGDDRYTYTLPKSGSDWRGGLNAAGDIARLLF